MKKILSLLLLTLTLASVLCGCSSTGAEENSLLGEWSYEEGVGRFVFNADGTCVLANALREDTFKYEAVENNGVYTVDLYHEQMPDTPMVSFTVELHEGGNEATFIVGDESDVYKKVN